MIPAGFLGKMSEGISLMSFSKSVVSGKFALNVGQIFLSYSLAITVRKPALLKP